MIDFHSHCLPAMDDGAVDRAEAVAMLTASAQQGIDTVVATSHFYRSEETVSRFLARRAAAVAALGDGVPQGLRLLLGAEVLLQRGLSKEDLHPLCIEGTNRILIELPFMSPMPWIYEELENIALGQRLDVILAHVDRYMPWYSSEKMAEMMDFPELTVQLNGECALDRKAFRALRRWLPPADRLVFGTDMHHIDRRPPNWQEAQQALTHKARSRDWLILAQETGEDLLSPMEGFF